MDGEPKIIDQEAPSIRTWYVVYCVVMALIYLLCAAAGAALLIFKPQIQGQDALALTIQAYMMLVMGIVLFIPFAIAPFLPIKPWNWIFGLVLICLGMTSCCCLPATIPLLIFWIKPETKAFYRKDQS
jgi:hypothetical protein